MTTTKRMVTLAEVNEATTKAGYEALRVRDLTNHPDDWYLKVVQAYSEAREGYVIWLYNATDRGLHEGYYTKSNEVADIKYWNKQ